VPGSSGEDRPERKSSHYLEGRQNIFLLILSRFATETTSN
jgi:hypothetical protein